MRKLHDSIADPKYDGVRITRSQLSEARSHDGDSEDDPQEDEQDNDTSEQEHGDLPSESEQDSSSQSEREDDGRVEHFKPASNQRGPEAHPPEELSSTLRKTRDEDRIKGQAVSRQIVCVVSASHNILNVDCYN